LCVEILSSNRIYDRVTKRMLYAAAGIPEFWCVEHTGEVERFSGENLSNADRYDDRLTTPLLPGFDLDLQTLIAP
jgi:Uma2 family endonuclease